MAELFLARVAASDRLVVIKRILPYLSHEPEFVKMFLDEARIAAQLDHPNIVQLHELGQLEGSIFITMEFVDGIDLRKILQEEMKRNRAVPYAAAAWITARVCEGLHYAHNRAGLDGRPLELIHRDVSPQNVMVGWDGRVKLVDFGIAKAKSFMDQSQPGVIKGKFLYLSPEQLAQNGIDHRADLFAVGTMLYEVTTGKSPFYKPTTEAVILAIRGEEPPPPHLVSRDYPLELSRIVMKCLAKDRAKRYQQASEISRDLDAFIRMQARTDQKKVSAYVAELFGDEGERTMLHVPPGPVPAATNRPKPGAQFADDEDDDPRTQMARPQELAQQFREDTGVTVAPPTRRSSGTQYPEAGAVASGGESTRTVTGIGELSQASVSNTAPTPSTHSDGPVFDLMPVEGSRPERIRSRPSRPRPPVPDEAFEDFDPPDEESTMGTSTVADPKRPVRLSPKWIGVGAAVVILLVAMGIRLFRSEGPVPQPVAEPEAPVAAAPIAAPPEKAVKATEEVAAPPPPAPAAEAANQDDPSIHSAVALLTQPLKKDPEKVPVVFKAPRGTRISVGRTNFAVGRLYKVVPGVLKVTYRCPGRRGPKGTRSFDVAEGRKRAQSLALSCRRK